MQPRPGGTGRMMYLQAFGSSPAAPCDITAQSDAVWQAVTRAPPQAPAQQPHQSQALGQSEEGPTATGGSGAIIFSGGQGLWSRLFFGSGSSNQQDESASGTTEQAGIVWQGGQGRWARWLVGGSPENSGHSSASPKDTSGGQLNGLASESRHAPDSPVDPRPAHVEQPHLEPAPPVGGRLTIHGVVWEPRPVIADISSW
jgi:hypothetical protein